MSATFNRAINAGTVNSSTFTLKTAGGTTDSWYLQCGQCHGDVHSEQRRLAASTTYTATLSTGIKDTNGVALAATYSWQFTTSTGGNPCSAAPNAIVAENCLPGNLPSEWDISGAGDTTIQGFATDISVNQGGTVNFKINTPATAYRLDIYRMGYYGGNGARKVATVNGTGPQTQPSCVTRRHHRPD